MPLYEYECGSCGSRFERIQKFSDPPLEVCPTCGGPLRKLISSPAIQFKGSGFYITDYGKAGQSSDADTSSKPEKKEKSEKTDSSGKADKAEKGASGEKPATAAAPEKSSKAD